MKPSPMTAEEDLRRIMGEVKVIQDIGRIGDLGERR